MSCRCPDERRSPAQPVRDAGHRLVPRQVDLEWRHCGRALLNRMKIGALARILALAGRANPVDRAAIRVFILKDFLGFVPKTKARSPDALQLVVGSIRNIDVEYGVGRQAEALK